MNASILQKNIIEKNSTLTKALIKQSSFHLTLKVLHLKINSEVEQVKNAFVKAIEKYERDFTNEKLYLDCQGIGDFFEQIIYAKLENENVVKTRLNPIIEEITNEITKRGIQLANQENWKPHLTLEDIRKVNKLRKESQKLHPSLSSNFKNMRFGRELVKSIQLLSIFGPKSKENYYEIISEVIFEQKKPYLATALIVANFQANYGTELQNFKNAFVLLLFKIKFISCVENIIGLRILYIS